MYSREPLVPIDVKHYWTKMKAKNKKAEKEMGMNNNEHSISTFLMPSFHQRRKSEQQSWMMQPTILKLLRKNKYEIMIADICLKQKLRWMILCY